MKLRWLERRNVVLAADVRHLADLYCISLEQANRRLQNAAPRELQYWDGEVWITVPTENMPNPL
jgi:hypothetical protein